MQGGNGVPGDWRKFKEKGGGMMLDWGVHLIDQAVVMFGGAPDSIYCSYSFAQGFDVDDGFKIILEYPNTVMEIVVDTDCYIKTPRWIVYGENGTAIIEDWDLTGKVVKPIFSPERKIAGIKAGNGFTKTMAYRTADSLNIEDLNRIHPAPHAFYKEFYDAVVGGVPMSIKHEQVMTVLKIMEAAEQSALSHKSVDLKSLKVKTTKYVSLHCDSGGHNYYESYRFFRTRKRAQRKSRGCEATPARHTADVKGVV